MTRVVWVWIVVRENCCEWSSFSEACIKFCRYSAAPPWLKHTVEQVCHQNCEIQGGANLWIVPASCKFSSHVFVHTPRKENTQNIKPWELHRRVPYFLWRQAFASIQTYQWAGPADYARTYETHWSLSYVQLCFYPFYSYPFPWSILPHEAPSVNELLGQLRRVRGPENRAKSRRFRKSAPFLHEICHGTMHRKPMRCNEVVQELSTIVQEESADTGNVVDLWIHHDTHGYIDMMIHARRNLQSHHYIRIAAWVVA